MRKRESLLYMLAFASGGVNWRHFRYYYFLLLLFSISSRRRMVTTNTWEQFWERLDQE